MMELEKFATKWKSRMLSPIILNIQTYTHASCKTGFNIRINKTNRKKCRSRVEFAFFNTLLQMWNLSFMQFDWNNNQTPTCDFFLNNISHVSDGTSLWLIKNLNFVTTRSLSSICKLHWINASDHARWCNVCDLIIM